MNANVITNVSRLDDGTQQPMAPEGTGYAGIGTALARIDGPLKVTGSARYAAEHPADELLYGVVVNSTIARGKIAAIDVAAAREVPGVVDVLTHEHRPHMRSMDIMYKDMIAPSGSPFKPLYDETIHSSGQPIALVVATTFEAARHAASLVDVSYKMEVHETDLMTNLQRAHEPGKLKAGFKPPPDQRGDPDAAFESAPFKVDSEFHSGVEHHNPMEMHATTVILDADGHMTVYDKTQGSQNCRWLLSHAFGISKSKLTVKNPFVGGAFGSGLRPQYPLVLAVMASLQLKRSVRVVLTRQQMFTFGHRPETWQRVRLAATGDGRLQAVMHDAIAETSRYEDYSEVVVNWAGQLYQCHNAKFSYNLVDLDTATPIDMRAPGAAHGVHALEVAMDELSYQVDIDPLQLRLQNYAERDEAEDLPYSTKELRACYQQGADLFGWERRPPAPRSMREGRELVGWGMATGVWDAMQMFARASGELRADGRLIVSSAASDIGTGTYTVMAQIAAGAMGWPIDKVEFRLGDSTLPVAPVEGGSSHVATVGSAVAGVCEKLQRQLWKLERARDGSPLKDVQFSDVEFVDGCMRSRKRPVQGVDVMEVLRSSGKDAIDDKYLMLPSMLKQRKYTRLTHSAVFCEVKVDEDFGTVRVTRVVSAIAAGRIINPQTARSQIIGGVVWGISEALHEESHMDHAFGRFMNHNFSEYHIPVNLDIADVNVVFVNEEDFIVNRLGAKGVGEIGLVGVAAAVSNAIFHATGRRLHDTPMTPDMVMAP